MKDSRNTPRDKDERERPDEGRWQGTPVRELARRILSSGAEAVAATEEQLRNLVGDVNPREAVSGILETVSKGTDNLQSVLVREARHYLNAINLQDELGRILSNYTIEVTAQLNFVPKEKGAEKRKDRAPRRDRGNARVETGSFNYKLVPKEPEGDPEDPSG